MNDLQKAVHKISGSKKYRKMCAATIANVLSYELGRHGSLKKAIGPARERLHKIWAEYLGMPDQRQAMQQIEQAFDKETDEGIRAACLAIMAAHSSAKERFQLHADNYYARIFDITGKPKLIADLACALHPLAFRWMGLPTTVAYHAYDINLDFVELVNHYFELEGLAPLAEWRDIYIDPAPVRCDVAFLFKMYHCLEHRQKGAGLTVLKNTQSDWVVISFPSKNLVGKKANIYGNYEYDIAKAAEEHGWPLTVLEYSNEVVLIVKKKNA